MPRPLSSSDPSVRRDSRVKRDFVCMSTRHFSLYSLALRAQSRLMLAGRARPLRGPSPVLSPPRTVAPSRLTSPRIVCRIFTQSPDPPSGMLVKQFVARWTIGSESKTADVTRRGELRVGTDRDGACSPCVPRGDGG